MAVQLVSAILALVLALLGATFVAIGFAGAGNDPQAFRVVSCTRARASACCCTTR